VTVVEMVKVVLLILPSWSIEVTAEFGVSQYIVRKEELSRKLATFFTKLKSRKVSF
jgi:hypothetical protein